MIPIISKIPTLSCQSVGQTPRVRTERMLVSHFHLDLERVLVASKAVQNFIQRDLLTN